ncbi:MAG TPA: gluconokinase [Opitutaceae bacterium]|nr:gluconokinase [Opitutaceae bacterium]
MNLIVMGAAGAGKTTVGRKLATRLGGRWRFDDADDFHPAANVAKMAGGTPLTDADRAPWLEALRAHLAACAARGESVVLACSALKEAYRRRLVPGGVATQFVYLRGDEATLRSRLRRRQRHFMPAALLRSQLADLEEPAPGAALVVDAARPPADAVERILAHLKAGSGAQAASPRAP